MPGVRDWLKKASSDLKAAKLLLQDDDVLDVAVYLSHQCAEKALKTYLVFCQSGLLKTHDLQKLIGVCAKQDSLFLKLSIEAIILNPYGMYSRYPDDRFSIDKEDATEAVKCAEKVLKFVKTKIEPTDKTPQLNIFNT